MDRGVALVTGAGGEMGHLLLPALRDRGYTIVALDLRTLPRTLANLCRETVEANVLDTERLRMLLEDHCPDVVFHLAAVLSSRAEQDPRLAHRINVQGTVGLMELCLDQARRRGSDCRFLFPSSIAVYGLPDAGTKQNTGPVGETEWLFPSRMYGCNKLYCEMLGAYYSGVAASRGESGLDFRAIRFPGLISAETVPQGGTSDYGPEMLHAAAQGRPYRCFVGPSTRLPFMTMPDSVEAFLALSEAPAERLSTRVYNIRAFSPSAAEFRALVLGEFAHADISFEPDPLRQAIVDGWPADVDDRLARRDWGFSPRHGFEQAVTDYVLPALRTRYDSQDPVGR